jgi:hypothetical protein
MARHEKDAGDIVTMRELVHFLFIYRLRALLKKEFNETRHDRKLMFSMTVMSVVQLILVGFALSAAVSNVPLAILDDSRSPESRELIATLTESESFRLAGYYSSGRSNRHPFGAACMGYLRWTKLHLQLVAERVKCYENSEIGTTD